jgi:hypothetical protein
MIRIVTAAKILYLKQSWFGQGHMADSVRTNRAVARRHSLHFSRLVALDVKQVMGLKYLTQPRPTTKIDQVTSTSGTEKKPTREVVNGLRWVQRPSWQPLFTSPDHEIPRLLWIVQYHYRVHVIPRLVPIQSQTNTIHKITTYFFKTRFKLILQSTPMTLKWPHQVFRLKFCMRATSPGRLILKPVHPSRMYALTNTEQDEMMGRQSTGSTFHSQWQWRS